MPLAYVSHHRHRMKVWQRRAALIEVLVAFLDIMLAG